MNDYEAVPRKPRRNNLDRIPGQSQQLCDDIHAADAAGYSYGVYMGIKASKAEQEYYEKFGTRMKRRRSK